MKTWQKLKNDPSLWQKYFIRETVIKTIRAFLDTNGFHEVETPLLISHPPAESYLEIFETALLDRNRNKKKAYLSTSPEVSIKKLLAAGIGNCYALTKSFRNMETSSGLHSPEFTILEWYRVGAPYEQIMQDCESLALSINHAVGNTSPFLSYQGKKINIAPPWPRLTMKEAFKTYAQIDFDAFLDEKNARSIAEKKGYTVSSATTWEEMFNQIFLNEVEPHLGQEKPTILYEFPGSLGALARKKPSDPRYAQRFEFYIAGIELGDCYQELTDAKEQQERFENELLEIKRRGKTLYDYDHDFIDALKSGLPDCSGIAVGVDRLVMLFADTKNIQDTLFFPAAEMWEDKKR